MVTLFSLAVFSLLLVSFSAGYAMGLEHNRQRRRAGGSKRPAASRNTNRATTHTSDLTRRIAAYSSSTAAAGAVSVVPVTQLMHPAPNSWRGVTPSIESKAGTPGRTPPADAGLPECVLCGEPIVTGFGVTTNGGYTRHLVCD